jgi:cytochrome c peroxidase
MQKRTTIWGSTSGGTRNMKYEPNRQHAEPVNRQGDIPTSKAADWLLFLEPVARAGAAGFLLVYLFCGIADAQGDSPTQLRQFIDQQVGGINKLMVPAIDADLPQPRRPDGSPVPIFQTTEAKRYLGKMLFFDPVRMARILPDFGGISATSQTASCGSCHLGEAAFKAGTLINFAVGGEGRGYTDAAGNFIPRRRPRLDILPLLRPSPLFPGDALVDDLPTLTDVYELAIGSPARGRKLPDPGQLLRTGRLDALDSVGRNAPSVIGAAFNNRLLLGGFAGEPDTSPGGLNPFEHPAQENVALLLLDAHRMLDNDPRSDEPVRFRDAFPEEAAQSPGCTPQSSPTPGSCDLLINDITILRATATFMRTAVSRNTPWDRFLAGDNSALTLAQRRGARLFFTAAGGGGAGGAGCYSCHAGPMLNKQVNDTDVAGTGQFVEENFFNLGLADHPVQALNRLARNDPNFRDDGRREITGRDSDAFKFRSLTLRQLRDGRFFFHNGLFTSVKDVVQYFNRGLPQDSVAAAAGTLTPRFTNPRGAGSPPGLGLSEDQVDDLTDFLENALYDPALVRFDPDSTTKTLEPNMQDLTYSIFRPDLAALGAVDGRMPSGLPRSNNDALSRRDMGLEFLDVTWQADAALIGSNSLGGKRQEDVYTITNNSLSIVDTHLLLIVRGLPGEIQMENASGMTSAGDPYLRVFLPDGVLLPGQSIVNTLLFRRQSNNAPTVSYVLTLLSGQGNP